MQPFSGSSPEQPGGGEDKESADTDEASAETDRQAEASPQASEEPQEEQAGSGPELIAGEDTGNGHGLSPLNENLSDQIKQALQKLANNGNAESQSERKERGKDDNSSDTTR